MRGTPRRGTARRGAAHWTLWTAVAAAALLCVACSPAAPDRTGAPDSADPSAPPAGSAPSDGWTRRAGPGFSLEVPASWVDRAADSRAAPQAALEVGPPFTGQPSPPPVLMLFVEERPAGPLQLREQLLRTQLSSALGSTAVLGPRRPVQVRGATSAVAFDVTYTTRAGTSSLGTPLRPTPVRQRELLVDMPEPPDAGVRYAAPVADFDEGVWSRLVSRLELSRPGSSPAAPGASG